MKCKIPEIFWHNRDPILSVDIQPKTQASTITMNKNYRLALGGTDAHVLIWHLNLIEETAQDAEEHEAAYYEHDCDRDIALVLVADLTRHHCAVNCVKWSPNGELLASGDDECVIFIWKQKQDNESFVTSDNEISQQNKEIWLAFKILRGHLADIYDLSWSPNSLQLVSGSADNSAIIWDIQEGKSVAVLNDHKGYVQGVAWDPHNQYIATLSTDRYLRIFDVQTKEVLQRICKGYLPIDKRHPLYGKYVNLYRDDVLQTFFRRLTFTPDGKLLLTPSGIADRDGVTHPLQATYIYTRYNLSQPINVLPCPDQYTVAISCCPLMYRLRPYNVERCTPIVSLPYRIIFAVASRSSVYFYDTQQRPPFAIVSNIHYTRLTDVTWSNDGRIVIVSTTDGFCSLITFEPGELGELFEDQIVPILDLSNNGIQENGKLKKHKEEETNDNDSGDDIDFKNLGIEINLSSSSDFDLKINAEKKFFEHKCINLEKETLIKESLTPLSTLQSNALIKVEKEKFETVEKRCCPVTSITTKKQPRLSNGSIASIKTATVTASTSNEKLTMGTPIDITICTTTPTLKDTFMEEKPLNVCLTTCTTNCSNYKIKSTELLNDNDNAIEMKKDISIMMENGGNKSTMIQLNESTMQHNSMERTEDIHLVYEETLDENSSAEPPKPQTDA